jgi:hypothetical protein
MPRRLGKEAAQKFLEDLYEHSMKLSDFHPGLEFWMSGTRWRCTDIRDRTVLAIHLIYDDTPALYEGPPYHIEEVEVESYDFPACSIDRHGGNGNSDSFSDEEVELLRTSGNYGRADWSVSELPEALERMRVLRDEGRARIARALNGEIDTSDIPVTDSSEGERGTSAQIRERKRVR